MRTVVEIVFKKRHRNLIVKRRIAVKIKASFLIEWKFRFENTLPMFVSRTITSNTFFVLSFRAWMKFNYVHVDWRVSYFNRTAG